MPVRREYIGPAGPLQRGNVFSCSPGDPTDTLPRMTPGDTNPAERRGPDHGRIVMVRCGQILPILILVVFVRVWLVRHTAVIADDGAARYTPMARQWSVDPRGTMKRYSLHVGYPAATAALHRVRAALGASGSLSDWDRSGQWVSLVAGAMGMVALWLLTGMTFNWRVAWMATLLFGVTRKWSADSADVLTDALALCMELWATVLAVVALGLIQRRSWWSLLSAAGTGVFAAGGYLVRPEASVVAALAVLLWLAFQLVGRPRWRPALACTAVMIVTAALCALPYMVEIGGFTKKKRLDDLVLRAPVPSAGPVRATALSRHPYYKYAPPRQFVNKLIEAMHPTLGILMCLWLAVWIAARIRRVKIPHRIQACPRGPGGFLMIASLVLIAPLTMVHYARAGSLSHRYVFLPAALLSGLAAAMILILAHACSLLAERRGWPPSRRRWILPIALAPVLAGLLLHTLRPRRTGKAHHLDAARSLRQKAREGDVLLTDSLHILRHAGIRGCRMAAAHGTGAVQFLDLVNHTGTTLVAVQEAVTRRDRPEVSALLRPPAFSHLGTFVSHTAPKKPNPIRVFRVDRAKSAALLQAERRRIREAEAAAHRRP